MPRNKLHSLGLLNKNVRNYQAYSHLGTNLPTYLPTYLRMYVPTYLHLKPYFFTLISFKSYKNKREWL